MAESIIVANFEVESEAYQAFSDLKRTCVNSQYIISQMCVLKNEGGKIIDKDYFDSGAETANDTRKGTLVGALIGVLGGPIGVILCGSMGYLIGKTKDIVDIEKNASLIERVCELIPEGTTSVVALAWEDGENAINGKLNNFSVKSARFDAAEVAEEVEQAVELQKKMEKEARKKLREEKKEAAKQKIEERRAKIKEDFEKRKAKFAKK
ncbi:MAG: hypothetical protein IJF98_05740 [Firmicutes bacterium]|nr:hypothetical protein [Bacillota bacterium]MBQ7242357.1 hypothetical protein [Bacillota bacterium]MBR0105249.1 hypothetical protein [Bacillota bacterium]